ncbi:hypothetical protein [Streptomyces nanhaiensis]|uniref:hypothetical protein n=1 Tax=Streptomyces nanhaiensis TaxID=679319 RepID=UPI00399CE539
MARAGGDLKAWLTGLDDVQLRELIAIPGPLPHWAKIPFRGAAPRPGRRELLSVRAWLSRAQIRDLRTIADASADFARHLLAHHDYREDTLQEPDLDTLESMIVSLPPVLARLTLHSILMEGGTSRRNLVEQHWARLLEAAAQPAPDRECGQGGDAHMHEADTEAAGQAREASADPQQRQDSTGKAGAEKDASDLMVTSGPAKALEALRSRATKLAEALDRAAGRVADGFALPQGLLEHAADWAAERSAVADMVQEVGRVWSAEGGFGELQEIVDELLAMEKQEAAQAQRLAALLEQRQSLLSVLEMAEQGGGGTHLESLQEALRGLDEQIAGLNPIAGAPPRTHDIAVTAPRPGGTDEALEPHPETESPTEAGEPVTPAAVPFIEEAVGGSPQQDMPQQGDGVQKVPPSEAQVSELPAESSGAGPSKAEASVETTEATTPAEPGTAVAPVVKAEGTAENHPAEGKFLPWQSSVSEDDPSGTEASPVERLVGESRFQEAYWLTVGSGEPDHRAECLAFADAAFSCVMPEDATPVMTRFAPDLERVQSDRPALVLAAVASVRAGLVVGWPNDLLLQTDPCASLSGPWRRLLECAIDVLRHYQRVDPAAVQASDETGPTLTRDRVAEEAARLKADLPKLRIGYARATQVQNLLIRPDQPLGRALEAVQDWASGTVEATVLDEAWKVFRKRDSAERIIEEADAAIRTPKQAKEPIEAKARRSLLNRIEQVVTLLSQARALAAPETEERSDTVIALSHALVQTRGRDALPGVEGAALLCLRRWLEGEDRTPVSTPERGAVGTGDSDAGTNSVPLSVSGFLPGAEALLAAPGLPRTPSGAPDPAVPGFAQEVASLLEPVDIPAVVTAYAERGDLHLVDALVEALEQGLVPAAAAGTEALPSDWRTRRDAQWARWSNIRSETHRTASALLAELRTQQSLDELTERDLVGHLERLEQPVPEGAFRSTVEEIRRLQDDLRGRVQAYVQRLRDQLESLTLSEEDRKRITGLLETGDTVTAEECLALLRKGDALPEWSGEDPGEDLERFVAGLKSVTPAKAGPQGFSALPWAESYADGQPLTEGALAGLESWDALSRPTTRGAEWQKHVPTVLRLLGLEGRPPARDDNRQVRGTLRLSARLRASESVPGYVAELGSAATTYTVLVVSDEQRGRSPLELLDRSDTGACIILYLYPLGLAGRRKMVMHARTSAQQALVVDPAVFGWVAARSPRSFRALQRVTLPWTGFNPYTPFVAGLVPPEVFYGRIREMAEVTDPLGALFLYGGRQLGKSALLRKVEADFPSTPDRKAVYLDLKARGVGEAEPADRIWPVLAAELKRVGVLGPKVSTAVSPDVLLEQVRRWLEDDRERRVLVLADEADAFLTADSKAVRGTGGEGTFANVAKLKGLMDSTDRHFKVVFAGLHQVQRFSKLSNVPLAHGGEVLIGPLKPAEAQRLVVEPMAAFGYRFERPELVWRVLAATNYQACLVQIFCERLVTALREKPAGSAHWPIIVMEEDIRAVTSSADVHRHIAERLRLTINLEDRYRVLTLVIALRSQADGFQRGYDADELLHEAKQNWPEGFRRLTASDVKIYLEEMVGLGLLIQQADRRSYAVRSPNVVHMLGTREDLELELRQTEFSLPYDYNPRFSRRLVGTDREGINRYSPLTEQQLHEATSPGLSLVCLTKAHAPKLAEHAVRLYGDARGLTVHTATPDTLVSVLTKATRNRESSVVVADLRYSGLDTLSQALERLYQHVAGAKGTQSHSAIALVDPRAQEVLQDERVTRVLRPERWNADSLRAWPECPFDTPDKRRRLIAATGGWPGLVERTVDLATRGGSTLEAALETVKAQHGRKEVAHDHLERVKLDPRTRELLTTWVEYVAPGECCNHGDIAAVTGLTLEEVRHFTDRLADYGVLDDSEEGYALDLVTFQALNTVRQEG